MIEDKTQRHSDIKEAISAKSVNSQSELLDLLIARGHNITQATLSRDLKQLKASKIPDEFGNYKYVIAEKPEDKKQFASYSGYTMSGFVSVEFSGNLGIIKTLPAFANTIASAIDKAEIEEVAGTIAGDDTILIISREGFSKSDVIKTLKEKFPVIKDKLS